MRAREFIFEAAYDSMIAAIKRQFPDQIAYIDQWVKWAKTALKKADRVIWFLKILRADLEKELSPKELGNYQFSNIQQLATDIHHFYGIDYAPIQNYVYKDQPVGQVIDDLSNYEAAWRKEQELNRGVTPQEGDYLLFEFSDGTAWWWVNRAYCPEEGRSGGHCGNVVGQHKKDQRILSLRNKQQQVICTFILESDGTLGEMKAKNNQKPVPKYHPQILKLLMWDRITGIAPTEGQYNPSANFNVFDLNEKQLVYVDQAKPDLITTQIQSNPISALNMPDSLKEKYQNFVTDVSPVVGKLLFNATDADWSDAVKQDPKLIIYAPTTIKNWRERVVEIIADREYLLYQAPAHIGKNYELLEEIVETEPYRIGEINPNLKGYNQLCLIAVSKKGGALYYIPDDYITAEMCEIAVKKNTKNIKFVPERLRTPEMYSAAIKTGDISLDRVPENQRTLEVCLDAVKNNGQSIHYVPDTLIDSNMYAAAVSARENVYFLLDVPEQFLTDEVYIQAVKRRGILLEHLPKRLITPEICKIAVDKDSRAIKWVPKEYQTEDMQVSAVKNNPNYIRHIPEPSNRVLWTYLASTYDSSYARLDDANGIEREWLINPPEEFQKIMLNMQSRALRFADPKSLSKDTVKTIMTDEKFKHSDLRFRLTDVWRTMHTAMDYYNENEKLIDLNINASKKYWETVTPETLNDKKYQEIEEFYRMIIKPVRIAIRMFRDEGSEEKHQEIFQKLLNFTKEWRTRLDDWMDQLYPNADID